MGDEQGAGFQLPPLRPDCDFLLVMEHQERASSTRTATDRYWEVRGLILACVEYVEDRKLRTEVEKALLDPRNFLSSNIIRTYKSEIQAGVPYSVIWETEYGRLLPIAEVMWAKVKRALIEQQLLPWTISDSEGQLENAMLDDLMARMNSRLGQPLRDITPKSAPEKLVASGGLMLMQERDKPPEASHEDAHEILTYAEKAIRDTEAMATRKPEEEQTSRVDPMPTPRIRHSLREIERSRSREGLASRLPKDYQVPPDVDEDVFRAVDDEEGFDPNTYVASDEELEEAARIWKRALRRKAAEKERTP